MVKDNSKNTSVLKIYFNKNCASLINREVSKIDIAEVYYGEK